MFARVVAGSIAMYGRACFSAQFTIGYVEMMRPEDEEL